MKKDDTKKQRAPKSPIEENFSSLPLEEKFKTLFKMEMAAVTEAVDYVVKDPMWIVEKIGKFIFDLGTRVEKEVRSAAASYRSGETSDADTKKGPAAPPSGANPAAS
jgi:hypothetical protein